MDNNLLQNRQDIEREVTFFLNNFARIEQELGSVLVGMKDVIRTILSSVFVGGHVLLEGVPGLGKTLLVKSVAKTLSLTFKRIQFTPDLMPSDVTGTQVLSEDENGRRSFVFKAGPVFTNILLADEINRATPKTQSALLEAMEEKQISVIGETYKLPFPFFVLATQNPVELEGTYPLPEAQLDRFLVKVLVSPPSSQELKEVLKRTTGSVVPEARPVFTPEEGIVTLNRMKQLTRNVYVPDNLQEVIVRIIYALNPQNENVSKKIKQYVRFGPGPRGAQSLMLTAKVNALLDSRINLSFDDIKSALLPCLRHRMILNFQADADGVSADDILEEIKRAK
jgi:MoxR-like ATPase